MLYRRGLAYQAEALVNYDPIDKTVLANEQVDSNGRSWRSGALVQQINLRQWFFRITAYKEGLLNDLDFLEKDGRWPERVLTQQRNWLGRSQGARVRFDITTTTPLHVFTTRPDTLFGVTYLALSLTHPVVIDAARTSPELQAFIDKKASFAHDSKAGFELPIRATSPLRDQKTETLPIFVAPYVLEGYGEGAVMGVPAHDSRDLAFWKTHRPDEAIPVVIKPDHADTCTQVMPDSLGEAYTGNGVLTSLCAQYAGLPSKKAAANIVADLSSTGRAEPLETWKLRDWLISRQRYWGTPIPIIHCQSCGTVPVPEEDLPVALPKLDASAKGQTGNPLEQAVEWVNTRCPQCQEPAKRETDTMDTFVDSSWYFTRFPDAHNKNELFSRSSAKTALPVDTYVGGVEHAILHLLYARFVYKFLCEEGLIPNAGLHREPFQQLIAQGMVHGKTYSDPATGRFLLPHEVDHSGPQPIIAATGQQPGITFEKMSKSKHNGVDPSVCIDRYGADATRAHVLFSAPVSEVLQWDEAKIVGIERWFGRIRRLTDRISGSSHTVIDHDKLLEPQDIKDVGKQHAKVLLFAQDTVRRVSFTMEKDVYSLNTTISDLIKLTNALDDSSAANLTPDISARLVSVLLRMLMPIAPMFSQECWDALYAKHDAAVSWPNAVLTDNAESGLKSLQDTMNCAVQVNGKLRFNAEVPVAHEKSLGKRSSQERVDEVVNAVLATDEGARWLTVKNDWSKKKRVIVAGDGKLLNVVF